MTILWNVGRSPHFFFFRPHFFHRNSLLNSFSQQLLEQLTQNLQHRSAKPWRSFQQSYKMIGWIMQHLFQKSLFSAGMGCKVFHVSGTNGSDVSSLDLGQINKQEQIQCQATFHPCTSKLPQASGHEPCHMSAFIPEATIIFQSCAGVRGHLGSVFILPNLWQLEQQSRERIVSPRVLILKNNTNVN